MLVVLVVGVAGGCASTNPQNARPEGSAAPRYAPAASAALAFDPPLGMANPTVSLSRDGRAPEAFAGYEQQVTTYSYVHQRDEIRHFSPNGDLEREAYTDRTWVTTR